jgi:hypothetical protein
MANQPETKTLKLELKLDEDAPEGAFRATFSTLNVIDLQGDVTLPGAFKNGAEVFVGAYQHEMWNLPPGKGAIDSDEETAWIDGEFFLDTTGGLDTYRTVKRAGGLMEWSYIFTVEEAEWADEHRQGDDVFHDVRLLKSLDVWSVDPVLRGAGIDTRTDEIKSRASTPFADHAETLVTAVGAFMDRAESRLEMRAKDDRHFSADDRGRLESLVTEIASLEQRLVDVLREPAADTSPDMEQMHLAFLELDSRLRAVA